MEMEIIIYCAVEQRLDGPRLVKNPSEQGFK